MHQNLLSLVALISVPLFLLPSIAWGEVWKCEKVNESPTYTSSPVQDENTKCAPALTGRIQYNKVNPEFFSPLNWLDYSASQDETNNIQPLDTEKSAHSRHRLQSAEHHN